MLVHCKNNYTYQFMVCLFVSFQSGISMRQCMYVITRIKFIEIETFSSKVRSLECYGYER